MIGNQKVVKMICSKTPKRDPFDEEYLYMESLLEDVDLFLKKKDWIALALTYYQLANIFVEYACFKDALNVIEKAETLNSKLESKSFLLKSLSYKGLIYYKLNDSKKALLVLKHAELICLELDEKDELWRIYGNQALAYCDSGHFVEALSLFEKAEKICIELCGKHLLSASCSIKEKHYDSRVSDLKCGLIKIYRGQADMFYKFDKLDEALDLSKIEEALCLELNLRSSLAYCYYRWGLLARKLKDKKAEREKLQAACQIYSELSMAQELDEVQKEINRIS